MNCQRIFGRSGDLSRWFFLGFFVAKLFWPFILLSYLKTVLVYLNVSSVLHIISYIVPISWGSLQFWKLLLQQVFHNQILKSIDHTSTTWQASTKNNTETSLLGTFTLPLGFFSDGRTGGVLLAKALFFLKTGAPYLFKDLTVQAVGLWIGMGCATCPKKHWFTGNIVIYQ